MKTKAYFYHFRNTDKPNGAKAYDQFRQAMKRQGYRKFDAWSGPREWQLLKQLKDIPGHMIELDTGYLFDDQWNTTDGIRIFDWREMNNVGNINHPSRTGYYLEQTPEMINIRSTTYQCRFCGKQYVNPDQTFCLACIDSEYLEIGNLPLLRLSAVKDRWKRNYPKLTDDEKAYLLPLFNQGREKLARIKREKQCERAELDLRLASIEYRGKIWLCDHEINVEHVYFYNHGRKFTLTFKDEKDVPDLSGFPYDYEIKVKGRGY
jgi:hypothetical protein